MSSSLAAAAAAVALPPEPEFAAFLALDWADQKHVWALLEPGGSKPQVGEVAATPEAVEAWVLQLRGRWAGRPIAVALEQKRGALLSMLSKYPELVIFPVHPGTVSKLREAWRPSKAKDDPGDAGLLLQILMQDRDKLRRLEADTVETRKLQRLVQDRRNLVDQMTAYLNQAQARLKEYFPQAVGWLDPLDSAMAADFLRRWPTLLELQKARPDTIRKFFHRHHCRSEALLNQRLEEIPKAVVATLDPAIVESGCLTVQALLVLIGALRTHIAALDRHIAALAAVHPGLALAASLPGAGPVLEPRLIAALGTDRHRFTDARELQIVSGIAPVTQRSGKHASIHFRWACPKFLRQTFHEWASHSITYSRWARAYYDDQMSKHHNHHAAVRALAFKWQRIVFRCWKDGTCYDENRYIESLRRRGSPLAAVLG
jgi:transposase